MSKVRWVLSYVFCSKFHIRFPAVRKFRKSVKIWQSYREFKGENLFWDTVCTYMSTRCSSTSLQSHCLRWLFALDEETNWCHVGLLLLVSVVITRKLLEELLFHDFISSTPVLFILKLYRSSLQTFPNVQKSIILKIFTLRFLKSTQFYLARKRWMNPKCVKCPV